MEKSRIHWMDFARSLAIILVVACHAVEYEYKPVRFGWIPCDDVYSWLFQTIVFTLGRLGVPIFLMLTGALLLRKPINATEFYKKHLVPLVMTTGVWLVINYFVSVYFGFSELGEREFFKQVLLFKSGYFDHMWYMPMIIGMYIAIPFVSKVLRLTTVDELKLPLLTSIVVCFVLPVYNAFAGEVFPFFEDVNTLVNTSFLGGTYGVYLILGYLIANEKLRLEKINSWILAGVFLIALGINTYGEYYLFANKLFHSDAMVWYTSPFILLMGCMLFALLKRLEDKTFVKHKIFSFMSATAFAVYLIHNVVMKVVTDMDFAKAIFENCGIFMQTSIIFWFAYIISIGVAYIAYKIPLKRLKKILFYIK